MSPATCPACNTKLEIESESRASMAPIIGAVIAALLSFLPLWVAIPALVFLIAYLLRWSLKLQIVKHE